MYQLEPMQINRALEMLLPKLNAQGDTNGKTPSSVNAYNNEMQHLHDEIEAVRRKANEVLSNDRATNTDVAMRQIILMMSH